MASLKVLKLYHTLYFTDLQKIKREIATFIINLIDIN